MLVRKESDVKFSISFGSVTTGGDDVVINPFSFVVSGETFSTVGVKVRGKELLDSL